MSSAANLIPTDALLDELSNEQFRELVDRELRKDHPSTSRGEHDYLVAMSVKLRDPAVLPRWISVLETMKASAETQLSAKRSDVKKLHGSISHKEYVAKLRAYESWRAGNVRFLHSVNSRLLEARYLRFQFYGLTFPERLTAERNWSSQALLQLIKAVEKHREHVLADYDPTSADESLWEAVGGVTKEVR